MFVWSPGPRGQKSYVTPDAHLAEELFRIKYKYAVTHANGMERLAFSVLPYSLLRSFALTFDPTSRFALASARVTPVNRTRVKADAANYPSRRLVGHEAYTSATAGVNTSTCAPLVPTGHSTFFTVDTALTDRPKLTMTSKDTTRRTREAGSDMGEFESFSYTLNVPERFVNRIDTYQGQNASSLCGLTISQNQVGNYVKRTTGGAAYFPAASMTSLRTDTIARTNTAITNRLSKQLATSLASSQRYTLARNVVELKDLPRSVFSLARTLLDFESAFRRMPRKLASDIQRAKSSKHVPEEWLSFWFGWATTYKAVQDLLEAPEKVVKDINYLMARKGRPTTVRRSVRFAGDGSTTPAFTFNPTSIVAGMGLLDVIESTATRHTWEHEVRTVMNLTFDFPEVGVPKLRRDLFLRKLGFALSPTDIYNLVPWTWLVDWFTGLGNYVELIDNINTDKSLINWGVTTGVTIGRITTEATCKFDNRHRTMFRMNFDTPITTETLVPIRRVIPAVLEYKCIVRKNIPASFGVKSTLRPEDLSPYQQSIIGAILQTRLNKKIK